MDRRKLVSVAINGVGAVIAGTVLIPSFVSSLSPALQPGAQPAWHILGALEGFSVGQVYTATAGNRGIFIWRRTEQDVVVFSRACTDLGCPLTWDAGSTWFLCPCHGGVFNSEGKPMAGPPKTPMWRYATRVVNDTLEIDMHSVPPMA